MCKTTTPVILTSELEIVSEPTQHHFNKERKATN